MGNSPAREKRSLDSHEHTLFHSYVEKGTTKQRCDVCRKEIYGLVYACETCKFSRHRWCAERRMPSEITHPSHSMHKLKLQDESSDFLCERCFHNSRGPRYHCYSCDIDVDLACASSTKDQLTREDQGLIPAGRARNRIKHFSHGEPLALFKYRKTTKYYELDCSWCDKRLSGMSYGCFKSGPYGCRFFLHESSREKRSLDSHEHTLFHSYVEKGTTKQRCDVCRKEIYGLVYACETCKFSRHRWCAERRMPSEITHPSHSMHKLKLQDESSDFLCERCFHNSRGPRYHCYSCDIDVDLACASSTKDQLTREDQGLIPAGRARNRIKHFSHGEPLALFKYRKTTKYYELDCSWCDKRLSGMSYGCFKSGPYGCRFFLHESCGESIVSGKRLHPRAKDRSISTPNTRRFRGPAY
ncbi:DC1 - like 10 [Theobroma cacao]|nr:DC1 - like 10 [Theobroma cacao]